MKLFNAEIFDNSFSFKASAQSPAQKYEFDYLDITKSKIKTFVNVSKVIKGDYILIHEVGTKNKIQGIIEGLTQKDGEYELSYKPITTLLDCTVYIDVEKLKQMTLENWMKELIEDIYKNNVDTKQNIKGLEILVESVTELAFFDLEDKIVDFYEDIIVPALLKYNIVISTVFEIKEKKVVIKIGKCKKKRKTIEADFPNIYASEIVVKKTKEINNKISVYNENIAGEVATFYLCKDGSVTVDPANADRVLPVVFENISFKYKVDSEETFTEAAREKASSKLVQEKYDNLIEIEVAKTDSLVKPLDLEIGQEVTVIKKGKLYSSILTGRKIEKDTVILIFGSIRLELTKILKRRLK